MSRKATRFLFLMWSGVLPYALGGYVLYFVYGPNAAVPMYTVILWIGLSLFCILLAQVAIVIKETLDTKSKLP